MAQLEGDGENESRPLPSASPQLLDTQSPHGAEEVIGDRPVSRRGAIMAMGAAAAGAAGVAVGSTILGAQPAAAADGDPMILGAGNAESKGMSVSNSGSGDAFAAVSIAGQNAFHGFVVIGPSFSQPQPASVSGETNQADTYGVYGGSTSADGVHAITTGNGQSGASGIDQSPTGGHGVYGRSENGTGVYGTGNVGVEGNTPDGIGVFGMGAPGVLGESNATSDTDFLGQAGVFGVGNQFGPGLQALNDEGASLFLGPYVSTTLPSPASPGQFIVLSNGSLWYCGVANKWVQLNKGFTNLLTTPIRVFDSRLSDNPADPSLPSGPRCSPIGHPSPDHGDDGERRIGARRGGRSRRQRHGGQPERRGLAHLVSGRREHTLGLEPQLPER